MNNVYINIGNEKCCFFVNVSIFLIKRLEQYPLLHESIEEFLMCAKNGYYSFGIITLSQLLNMLKKKTPEERHKIAHEVLKTRPSKIEYQKILSAFEKAAQDMQNIELSKFKSPDEYKSEVEKKWNDFIKLRSSQLSV